MTCGEPPNCEARVCSGVDQRHWIAIEVTSEDAMGALGHCRGTVALEPSTTTWDCCQRCCSAMLGAVVLEQRGTRQLGHGAAVQSREGMAV